MRRVALCLVLFAGVCTSATARTHWVVCDFDVQVRRVDRARETLTAHVLRVRGTASPECPSAGGDMTFTPETRDYQSTLPRQQWPRAGERAILRYRHLDGVCKDAGPCRIRHHSLLPADQ